MGRILVSCSRWTLLLIIHIPQKSVPGLEGRHLGGGRFVYVGTPQCFGSDVLSSFSCLKNDHVGVGVQQVKL